MVWECGHQVFSLSSFSTGRDAYLKYIYFKLKTLLKKISGTRCISTDKGRLLNLFNLKLKMLQNLYFDLKSHLVTYFHLSVLHPNLLHKIKRCGFFKLVLGSMNWQSAKGPSVLSLKGLTRFMSIYGKSLSTFKNGLHDIKWCTILCSCTFLIYQSLTR